MVLRWLLLVVLTAACCCNAAGLRVVTEDLPPYQLVENGKLVGGTSLQTVLAILQQAGIKSRIEVLPWARAYATALHEQNVLIFTIARTSEREAQFHWLYKLDSLHYYFYGLQCNPHIQQLNEQQLPQFTIAAVRGSTEASRLKHLGFIEGNNLILTVTYQEAWQLVRIGRADLIYASDLNAQDILKPAAAPQQTLIQVLHAQEKSDLYLAAGIRIDPALLAQLQQSIQALKLQ